jgi:hypothetical protein
MGMNEILYKKVWGNAAQQQGVRIKLNELTVTFIVRNYTTGR